METFQRGASGLIQNEPLLFELGRPGRRGVSLAAQDVPEVLPEDRIPHESLRDCIKGFPELSQVEVVRHFTRLSQWNYGVDTGFYPLGSCTMKHNPKINEELASLVEWRNLHPYTPEALTQGAMRILYELERFLCEISGMDAVTLQPCAGAQGELAGMMIVRAYHKSRGNPRKKVLIPDTAHGTNPASSALCDYEVVQIPSGKEGILTAEGVEPFLGEDVAALMVTNPNTLGLFERHIGEVAERLHSCGALVYGDGANLNALLGVVRPGDTGVDLMHFNLHKTFSTPHGGGGPGAGPLGVKEYLSEFLPVPVLKEDGGRYHWDYDRPRSIGRLRAFYANFGVALRAYVYVRALGPEGLRKVSEIAVLNANYVRTVLKDRYHLPYPFPCMHECVFSDRWLAPFGINTMDVAKRLIDYGFHPPTIYFPIVVPGAIMIEPTETETKEEIDLFCDAMVRICDEAKAAAAHLHQAPQKAKVSRLDEVQAARKAILRWEKGLS